MTTSEISRLVVDNPATGAPFGSAPHMSTDEVAGLVNTARAAQPAWQAAGANARAEVLYDLRRWLINNRDELIATVSGEGGRTHEDVLFGELFAVTDALGFWARRGPGYIAPRRVRSRSPLALGRRLEVHYHPRGVIGVIAPWNFPLALGVGDSIPALMAGNSVVLKPSGITPLGSLMVERGWRAVGGPPDVFRIAVGRGGTGSVLVDSTDMIMFTGSAETGKQILGRAAGRMIPVSLELGGKDPMIVLADADLERAASLAVQFAFWNSGQLCMSVERVYVEAPVYEEFVDLVVAKTRALRQGPPGKRGTVEVGAMIVPEQADIVEAQVNDARARGARVLTGGDRLPGPGSFFAPTVLVDVTHEMDVMREETFGPLLPVMRVTDADEAVRLANDSPYGLNSSVFTRDLMRGREIATRIEAGNTCVNDVVLNAGIGDAPFGAAKESGMGVRNGPGGIRKYCTEHTVLITGKLASRSNPLDWPNSAAKTRIFERTLDAMWGRRRLGR